MFPLACLLAGGFILSGIIEAQVILGFSKSFFNFINFIKLFIILLRISPKWSAPGKPGWREEEEFILSGPVLKEVSV